MALFSIFHPAVWCGQRGAELLLQPLSGLPPRALCLRAALFGAAVRTSLRLLFCCILHPLGLPLFAAWLIGSVLTVPLEYAYVRLTGPWWSSYALRRS